MPQAKIPGGMTPEHFMEIRRHLHEVLRDIETVTGAEPKWVSCRLNETGRGDPSPFFVGWVENDALQRTRVGKNLPDPGLFRFGDNIHSQLYAECLQAKGALVRRDWSTQRAEVFCKNLYLPNVGVFDVDVEKYRVSVAVKVNNRCVGTLNTGLSKNPGTSADGKMAYWAQDSKSPLVQYLKKEFELGGPTF